ncbi:VWA domain-containing protein [Chiayiivirga flava]|uniref:Ca-activated chloride channel family protein n=1 Tax=Chiayiivirga flava TaxID=659595 RepID=A0A7W8G1C8_9GAMM|nr:VWA domain-containing protein [Chiayiivirga flava]MBB5209304.1 Ca-activated chloride channel family protein [Chiayiivirga flava]
MSAVLAQFHFLRPGWLLALAALPLLLWLWRRRQHAEDPWRRVCDAHLLPHLLERGRGTRGWLAPALFSLAFVIAVAALAGPAYRQLPQPLSRADSALIVAIDLSDTMRATDLKPDRATRARFKLTSLLGARREGQTGLIAFGGDAFTVAPLTDDAGSLLDLAGAMQVDIVPVRGKRADRAIALATRLLRDAGFESGDLLLITDAVEPRAIDAARTAAASGLRVSVLGAGTAQGAPAPLPDGGFVPDADGGILLAKLDDASLRALADAGGGRYAALTSDGSDLAALGLDAVVGSGARLRADERTAAAYRDEGPWLLLALLPLAALAFRRGWLACLALLFALPAPQAQAFEWDALWKRDDQRAWDALQNDDAAAAQQLARDAALRGSAAYRAEDYAAAERDFAQRSDADAHYNRGNALAKAARYEEAIAAYDEALAAAPGMDDAIANRAAVEAFLKQQQQDQQQQQQDGDTSQQQDGEPQDGQQPQEGDPQQGDPQQDSSDSKDGQQQEQQGGEPTDDGEAQDGAAPTDEQQRAAEEQFAQQMEDALKDGEKADEQATEAQDPREAERDQAAEQWLRRVPDDPGGLLRRKFALEYQRRLRDGEGNDPP